MRQEFIDFFLHKNITVMLDSNEGRKEAHLVFCGMCKEILKECGIPYPASATQIVCIHMRAIHSYSAYFNKSQKRIHLFPKNIEANNFQYFHILCHELFHLIQDFVIECEMTQEKIKDFSYSAYKTFIKKYYRLMAIDDDIEEYFNNFKKFISTSPLFGHRILSLTLFDYIKHSNSNKVCNCNVAEMMANAFAVEYMVKVFGGGKRGVSSSQIEQMRLCIEYDMMQLDAGKEADKKKAYIMQNLVSSPKKHFKYLHKQVRMELPYYIQNMDYAWDIVYDIIEEAQCRLYL